MITEILNSSAEAVSLADMETDDRVAAIRCVAAGFVVGTSDQHPHGHVSGLCPRCKDELLYYEGALNPLSRGDDKVYICESCAANERVTPPVAELDDVPDEVAPQADTEAQENHKTEQKPRAGSGI